MFKKMMSCKHIGGGHEILTYLPGVHTDPLHHCGSHRTSLTPSFHICKLPRYGIGIAPLNIVVGCCVLKHAVIIHGSWLECTDLALTSEEHAPDIESGKCHLVKGGDE